jgi:hypothetical protein
MRNPSIDKVGDQTYSSLVLDFRAISTLPLFGEIPTFVSEIIGLAAPASGELPRRPNWTRD